MAEKSDWEHNIMPGNLPGAEFIKPIFSDFFLSLLGNALFE